MRINKMIYEGRRASQIFLLCLFSFFVNISALAQWESPSYASIQASDIGVMARAARSEGLDKSESFLHTLEAFKQELAGKYLFDEQSVAQSAADAFSKMMATMGEKQLLIRQIFHALPQHVTNLEINTWQQRMDSVCRSLASGADFVDLMNRYSDTNAAVWMRRLDMTDEMEQVVSALQKGQISQPFLSPLGIHIIQLLDVRQTDKDSFVNAYVQRVKNNTYPNQQTTLQTDKLKQAYSFTENAQAVSRLYREGKVSGELFTLNGKAYTGEQLARFAQAYPMNVRSQYEAFVTKSLLDLDVARLAERADYTEAVQGLADRLLAQEAYRKYVSVPSQTDEAGLKAYFSTHQKDYRWPMPRFSGAVIHAADKKTAKKVRKAVKKLKGREWKDAVQLLDSKTRDKVLVEQGVFALGMNAFIDELEFRSGHATPLADYPVAMAVGKKINGPDDYREVREQLVSDYERYLYEKWLADLRKQK